MRQTGGEMGFSQAENATAGFKNERFSEERNLSVLNLAAKAAYLCNSRQGCSKKEQQLRSFFARIMGLGKFTIPVMRAPPRPQNAAPSKDARAGSHGITRSVKMLRSHDMLQEQPGQFRAAKGTRRGREPGKIKRSRGGHHRRTNAIGRSADQRETGHGKGC
jgi:hypothetical protein